MTTAPMDTPSKEQKPVPTGVAGIFAALRNLLKKPEAKREIEHGPDGEMDVGTWNLRISLEPDPVDGGFVAECLDLPGCVAQGETEEEALNNIVDAFNGVVAVRMQEHLRESFDLSQVDPVTHGRSLVIPVP